MSYVPEEITEEDLWRVIPVDTVDSSSSEANAEVADIGENTGCELHHVLETLDVNPLFHDPREL